MQNRIALACGALALSLCIAGSARAQLDYNYVEFLGSPFFDSPVKIRLGEEKVSFSGTSIGGQVSYAFHPNWHVRLSISSSDSDTGETTVLRDPITDEPAISGRLELNRFNIAIVPTFNYPVAKKTDIYLGLGAIFEERDFNVRLISNQDRENLFEDRLKVEEWGVIGRGGVRSRVWRALELFGEFNVASVGLLENEIFFNLGARYDFFDTVGLSAAANVGTDSFVGVSLGLRLYYTEAYRRMVK